ncbi:hypothetical protein CF66_2263 [Candidatus Photodesmus katoptron]|uniref:CheW-like protein n=1 Tax=Candidatus Photodesmus katoptron Akat1 TaxID=1236703 RepID=S3DJ20_9GAMM|nr:chemotaxis protein CheW [Candidatus Photodesmus katoptron]EPE37700.1 CheW-like protein [Candidatus Photodesmus katoptron Akat1]KEY90578.1 hypothetical protein CF66_2263 [Candidatus Photodesmus katoptron]
MSNNHQKFSSKTVLDAYIKELLNDDEILSTEDFQSSSEQLLKTTSLSKNYFNLKSTNSKHTDHLNKLLKQLESDYIAHNNFDRSSQQSKFQSKKLKSTSVFNHLSYQKDAKRINNFPVLYFKVNGITLAVPLDELGGIYPIGKLNRVIGTPNWYLGVQVSKNIKLDVVDTAKLLNLSSRKLTCSNNKELKYQYRYIMMLGDSVWCLASSRLESNEILDTSKVSWYQKSGKLPWIAGILKEKMCALIYVDPLVSMLNLKKEIKARDK